MIALFGQACNIHIGGSFCLRAHYYLFIWTTTNSDRDLWLVCLQRAVTCVVAGKQHVFDIRVCAVTRVCLAKLDNLRHAQSRLLPAGYAFLCVSRRTRARKWRDLCVTSVRHNFSLPRVSILFISLYAFASCVFRAWPWNWPQMDEIYHTLSSLSLSLSLSLTPFSLFFLACTQRGFLFI